MPDAKTLTLTATAAQLAVSSATTPHVNSLRSIITGIGFEITVLTDRLAAQLAHNPGYRTIQAIPGVGPILAAVISPRSARSLGFLPRRRCARGRG
ncbi:MAG: hypothetical protein ACRDRN_02010 [Sciscionella sp.]